MKYRVTAKAFVCGALAAVLLAGCGGSSTLSHSELISKAGAACKEANSAAAGLTAPGNSYTDLARYAKQLSPIVQSLIGKLSALKAGTTDKPSLDAYVGALRTGERGLGLLATATSSAQATQATSLMTQQSLPQLASKLGVPACASSPST